MTREEYQRYLASRAWAVLREAVRQRAGGRCERCHHGAYQETHHLTYARIGAEHLEDLQGLCGACHRFLSAKTETDPADIPCTYFVAGPITPQWHQAVSEQLGVFAHLVFPLGADKKFNHVTPAEERGAAFVAQGNASAMGACCGTIAMLDRGDRVGTVCDVIYAATTLKHRILLVNLTAGWTGLDCTCGEVPICSHGMDIRLNAPPSPVWYLFGMLEMLWEFAGSAQLGQIVHSDNLAEVPWMTLGQGLRLWQITCPRHTTPAPKDLGDSIGDISETVIVLARRPRP